MNKNIFKVNIITGIINLLISVFALVSINTFLHPCRGEKIMACNYSTTAASLILILIALLEISKIIASENKSLLLFDIITTASAVELFLIPQIIGSCGMATMACNVKTMPSLTIASLIFALLSVISIVGNMLKARSERR